MSPEPKGITLKELCLPGQGLRWVWMHGAGVGVALFRGSDLLSSKSLQKALVHRRDLRNHRIPFSVVGLEIPRWREGTVCPIAISALGELDGGVDHCDFSAGGLGVTHPN